MANKVGRPTAYKPEYVQELIDFFNVDKDEGVLPLLSGFACKIGVHRGTLNDWAAKHEEFADAYARAKEHQERLLIANGLNGTFNSQFAMFVGKSILGLRDKQEVELTVLSEAPSEITEGLLSAAATTGKQ